jgi:hypothetical protein
MILVFWGLCQDIMLVGSGIGIHLPAGYVCETHLFFFGVCIEISYFNHV